MAGRLSKPVLTTDLPDYYPALSRKVFKVMEDIGASIEMRDLCKEIVTLTEIIMSLHMKMFVSPKFSSYWCGSQFEGTTTPGMQSDLDMLEVHEDFPVVVDICSAQQYKGCLLMVQDSHTPAGYAKLQGVRNGVPLSADPYLQIPSFGGAKVDREGRLVMNLHDMLEGFERHGPADTVILPEGAIRTQDMVYAVRCRRWPDCADEWLTRPRRYNWPDPVLLDKCKSLSCFFVAVGHPSSDERQLQWRISFSLQERLLVTHFNSTQLKCYILMKLMKKEILPPLLQEGTITSYHCKTCLLYMIENTPASFWKEENLLTCLYNCIEMIYRWVENGICPNYFIPDENMFDGRISEQLRVRLCSVLRTILASNFKFLLRIKSDDLGTRLENCCTTPNIRTGYWLLRDATDATVYSTSNIWALSRLLSAVALVRREVTPSGLFAVKQKLLETESVTEHTREETQIAISLVSPYIDLRLMTLSIVAAKRSQTPAAVIFEDLMSDKWHEISSQLDPFSAKLKQANYLYMLGYHRVSLDILLPLADKINQNLVSLCVCSLEIRALPRSFLEDRSVEKILKHHVIPCVQFLKEEKDLTPTALCYEMISFPGGTTWAERVYRSYKTDSARVDGKILLYFLSYLNHRALGMETHARADIENIHWVIGTDENLNHKTTALNLLGWIYKEMGRVDKAMECLNNSLNIGPQVTVAIQPQENAAIRHIKDIENVLLCMIQPVRS